MISSRSDFLYVSMLFFVLFKYLKKKLILLPSNVPYLDYSCIDPKPPLYKQ